MQLFTDDEKQGFFSLFLIMALVTFAVSGAAISILYHTAVKEERLRLFDIATGQAALIESMAKFDAVYSQHDHPDGALGATLSQIKDAFALHKRTESSGEFLIGTIKDDRITFLLSHQHQDVKELPAIPVNASEAEPMRRALRGESGTMIGPDYRNVMVLAAYLPIPALRLGIVIKVDLAKIRAPFLRAAGIVALIALLLVALGALGISRISNRIILKIRNQNLALQQYADQAKATSQQLEMTNSDLTLEIAQHRQTTSALQKSEAYIRMLLNSISEGIFGLDQQGACTVINPAALRLLGYTDAAAVIGKNMHDMIHHTRRDGTPFPKEGCRLLAVLRSGRQEHLPDELLWRADHTHFDAELHSYPLTENHTTIGAVVTFLDITERKQAEQALRASEQKYRRLHESLRDGFASVDMTGRILDFNQTYADMLGYQGEELPTLTYVDLTPAKWHAFEAEIVEKQVVARGFSEVYEKEYFRKDGSVFPVELRTFLLRDDGGTATEMWAIVRDISERKAMERELALREARLDAFFSAAPIGMAILDRDCRYVKTNAALTTLFALAPEDHLGEALRDLLPPDLAEATEEGATRIARTGKAILNQEIMSAAPADRAGQKYWIQSLFPLPGEDGPAPLMGEVVADITSHKKARQELLASLNEKETLLKEIHHRVKNNMQIISSLLALQADQAHQPETRLVVEECRHRVRTMALIHEKLYRSRDLGAIDFADYLRDLIADLWRSQQAVSTKINFTIQADQVFLPLDTAIPCGLIINELVTNATKHAFTGRAEGEVTIRFHRQPEDNLCLIVSDNGNGLPDGLSMADAPTLGLVLVNSLAQQINATIAYDSEKGVECRIIFPYTTETQDV